MEPIEIGNEPTVVDEMSPRFRQSFERVEPEMKALAESDLSSINLDVPSAVATVLGAVPEIRKLLEAAASLTELDLTRVAKLEDYALALGYAHAVYRAASEPNNDVTDIAAEALTVRDTLYMDAIALGHRRLLDQNRLARLRSNAGYKNIAFDVLGLVALLREHWAVIQDKTAVRYHELEAAERLADRLITAVGLREQGPVALTAAVAARLRAYTLFLRSYDEARRAVQYLRWHQGDADTIAPSLYAGRASRKRPMEPIAQGGTSGAPTTPASPAPPGNPRVPAGTAIGVGLPGSSPFSDA